MAKTAGGTALARIYLAGPEVFLREAQEIAERKKAICHKHGFEGVFPLDASLDLEGLRPGVAGLRISQANEALIRDCDALIANMTPFRGIGMDAGTAFEMGFMRALGRPVLGYTNARESVLERTRGQIRTRRIPGGRHEDSDRMMIEDHGFADNLMLEGAVIAAGARVVRHRAVRAKRYTDLTAFTACVRTLRALGLRRATRG
jgi:nucleoside 2-deoxyribosyltransferase